MIRISFLFILILASTEFIFADSIDGWKIKYNDSILLSGSLPRFDNNIEFIEISQSDIDKKIMVYFHRDTRYETKRELNFLKNSTEFSMLSFDDLVDNQEPMTFVFRDILKNIDLAKGDTLKIYYREINGYFEPVEIYIGSFIIKDNLKLTQQINFILWISILFVIGLVMIIIYKNRKHSH